MAKTNEVKRLREALESANDMCRTMAGIAERHGRSPGTNWEAFRNKLQESLALQHEALTTPKFSPGNWPDPNE